MMLNAGVFDRLVGKGKAAAGKLPALVSVRDAHEPTLPESLQRPARGTSQLVAPAPARSGLRRWWLVVPAVLAVLAGGLLAYQQERAAPAASAWTGTIEARVIAVGSRVGGRVKEILVREGDLVVAGQPLVALEPGDLDARMTEAQGAVEAAQALLTRLERGSSVADLEAARARCKLAEHEAREARRDLDQARTLYARGSLPRLEVDLAARALRSATAEREVASETLARLQRGTEAEDLQAARGGLHAARGKLDSLRVAIEELTVYAPGRARVETLEVGVGDLLAPDAAAVRLTDSEQPFVRAIVPARLLGRVAVGDVVRVRVAADGAPDRPLEGRVERLAGGGEARIRVVAAGGRLRIGSAATIESRR
jgi:HlyD family secretion protein